MKDAVTGGLTSHEYYRGYLLKESTFQLRSRTRDNKKNFTVPVGRGEKKESKKKKGKRPNAESGDNLYVCRYRGGTK